MLGDGPWSNGLSFTTAGGIAIERIGGEIPVEFELYPSYPNPFNPETTIQFDIAQQSNVRLVIYDALGREVDVLVSEQLTAGRYEYNWNASRQPSGLFLYRLEAGAFSKTGRMLLVK
ncbi:MAG: T9SS type A sorting domain-containing protein [Bacteroidetes bacterium]|nr:MAG: T9SS type A sorting domain-containing protein [Bacteroidota bacterium]